MAALNRMPWLALISAWAICVRGLYIFPPEGQLDKGKLVQNQRDLGGRGRYMGPMPG